MNNKIIIIHEISKANNNLKINVYKLEVYLFSVWWGRVCVLVTWPACGAWAWGVHCAKVWGQLSCRRRTCTGDTLGRSRCHAGVQCRCTVPMYSLSALYTVHWGPHVFLYSAQVGGEQQATINCISLQASCCCSRPSENDKKVFFAVFYNFLNLAKLLWEETKN